jgi:hypothetical protein
MRGSDLRTGELFSYVDLEPLNLKTCRTTNLLGSSMLITACRPAIFRTFGRCWGLCQASQSAFR